MKRILLCLTLFLLIPLASSLSLDMKGTYQPGETLIAELTGNILEPIDFEDVEFKTGTFGNVNAPIEYDLQKIGNSYFLYALLPNTIPENPKNYSVRINDVLTTINGVQQRVDFQQNFTIEGSLISYSLKPGFVSTNSDFSLIIKLNNDTNTLLETSIPELPTLNLKPGDNTFQIPISSLPQGLNTVNIGLYSIPVFIIDKPSNSNTTVIYSEFKVYPERIDSIIVFGQSPFYPFRITNPGEVEISDLELVYNQDLFLISSHPNFLGPQESVELNLTLKNSQNSLNISDLVIIRSRDFEMEIPVEIFYTSEPSKAVTPYLNNYSQTSLGKLCKELNGEFCSASQTCSKDSVNSIDGNNCCLGVCEAPSESNYSWIGWLIGAVILIILVIVGGRYFKSRKTVNPLDKKLGKI